MRCGVPFCYLVLQYMRKAQALTEARTNAGPVPRAFFSLTATFCMYRFSSISRRIEASLDQQRHTITIVSVTVSLSLAAATDHIITKPSPRWASQRRPGSSPRSVPLYRYRRLLPQPAADKTIVLPQVKRIIGKRDERLKENKEKASLVQKKKEAAAAPEIVRAVPQAPSSMFFSYNSSLVPPYNVLVE